MILRLAPLLIALLTLTACSQTEAPSPATAPVVEPAAPVAAASPAVPAPSATEPTAPVPAGPIVPPTGPAPVAGTDYAEIAGGQPFMPGTGKIEVVEVFSYTCGHCASFEPMLVSWKARLPADVVLIPVAGPFGPNPMPFAKAFYAAQTMGLLDKTHETMFRAVHLEKSLPVQNVTPEEIGTFYAKFGANPQQFASTMASFAVDAKVKRGIQFMQRSGVDSSPTLLVDGKYRVIAETLEESLRIAEHLIAQQRAARAGTAATAPASGG